MIDEEVLTRLSKLKLKEEEEGILLLEKDVSRCTEEGERSLFGKI